MENPETIKNWSKNSKYWKWGLFYYNPEDKRIIVDKKNSSFGSTLNFAQPKSYLFITGAIFFFGFIIFMILSKKKL